MAVLGLSTAFSPPRGSWIAVRLRNGAAGRSSGGLSLRRSAAAAVAVRAEVSFVDGDEAKRLVAEEGYTVLDVRDRRQYERAHVRASAHVPLYIENEDNDIGTTTTYCALRAELALRHTCLSCSFFKNFSVFFSARNDHQAASAQQLRRPLLRPVLHQAQPGLHQDGEEQVLAGEQAAGRLPGRPQVHSGCRCIGARGLPEPGLHHLGSSDIETRYQHSVVLLLNPL
uniref:Predicted protein n=1 Tax=Hordeum vulgare subsp. vulgare TaxID=112509 RepID=F2DD74_HORVV|nr:predicted protein [Hordeum vulgare subsp. vulgare]